MSDHSRIEWTDATWNPVTGCNKVSPGCKHCYAQVFAERFRGVPGHPYEQGFDLRLWPERVELPLRWRAPRRVFVNSMSDLFHVKVPDEFILRVFATMRSASQHQFQLLTKRPERMAQFLKDNPGALQSNGRTCPNIWLGASVENETYVPRAEIVAGLPSLVRFLSCEPLLGPLDLWHVLGPKKVNWVIVGGESGRGARPMKPEWAQGIRDACVSRRVPFFFKQWGGVNKKTTGRTLGQRTWDEMPSSFAHVA